ncbi:hypothetical protein EV368DRAFT_89146 [Lentinula lateritia]|uniref:Uncharacterized protein n=1 Tax=Lentinula aff. lateritia TaxID=2804960 RepID=A0ACC1TKC8_9AGAR|nr:hypothetical protein F5876DRAFT_82115 [Lentinula aff. lateritia]KAJ3846370.1 hypothetical protein EV368DRAFT_89146 [Lentinula lateritia]
MKIRHKAAKFCPRPRLIVEMRARDASLSSAIVQLSTKFATATMAQLSDCESLFSTTRINRLLRPLRNKCSTLAVSGTRTASLSGCTTTYSSTKSFTQPDIPPLRILSLPASILGLEETSGEWSRKIYAVRNAFNDIVEKTAGPRIQSGGDNTARLPSLSTLCALVIGKHAEPDIEEDTTRFEEECSVDVVETLYKEIPALYRGSTLVSHSLHIILDVCPLSPTLLKLLLDITLNNNLVHHSEIILRRYLLIALTPSAPTRSPPICHPAHSNFLVELLRYWEQNNNPSCVFFKTLDENMAVVGTYDIWVCKATTKLLLDCRKDPLQLTSVSGNLVRFISKPELHLPSRQFSVSAMAHASPTETLRRSLRVWLECVLHFLLLPSQSIDLHCFYDFLSMCKECWIHLSPDISTTVLPSSEQDAVSAIVSVTTLLLSQRLVASHAIFQILSEKISPSTTLFSLLISKTLVSSACLPECIERIQTYGASLRKHGFLELEVSLWASALREVENSELLLQRYAKDALHVYRSVLIDCVEDAEKRCYGCLDGGLLDIMNSPSVQRQKKWGDIASGRSKSKYTRRRQRPHLNENQYRVQMRSSDQNSACRNDRRSTQPKKRPRLMPHRVSSFTSLLSNALSNHVVLHEERDPLENGLVSRECLDDRVDVVGHSPTDVGIEELYGEDFESIVPSSDDCLDLLAYGISSPV